MSGVDTAGEIQNTYASVRSEFGTNPVFWLRYFPPSPAADLFSSDPVAESLGAWNSGGPHVGAIMAPVQSRLTGTSAEGLADGQTFCAALLSAWNAVAQLKLPTNNELWCFLDQEASTSLSLSYWDGWASYVGNYNFGSLGTFPLFPCLYCNPGSPFPNCSTLAQTSGVNTPVAVWSSEPEPLPCRGLGGPPAWDAETCATVPTKLWQWAEQGPCGFSANVDLDQGSPGIDVWEFCFSVVSEP
jgi:hypothetical protein